VPPNSLDLAPVPLHHEDLERMVLSRADVGGLRGFEADPFRQGYHDNAELTSLEVAPPATCQDIERFGRIEGYGNAHVAADGSGRSLLFAVHLFWTPEGAVSWSDAFVRGLAAGAGGGGSTFRELPGGAGVAESVLIEHDGPVGTRTWASFVRGSIVAWIVDLHPGPTTTIDVPAAAAQMADRIDTVIEVAGDRPRHALDVAQLLSAPLPKIAYGDVAAAFDWDFFFGGCQDTAERGFIAGEQAAADAKRFGRLTGCTAMYAPAEATDADVVRVFSSIHVYREARGASAALAAAVSELEARGGLRSPVVGLADEAVVVATPAGGEAPADTRVLFRLDDLVAIVAIQGPAATGAEAGTQMVDLARQLDARIRGLLEPDG
jgi:hypothetical protein